MKFYVLSLLFRKEAFCVIMTEENEEMRRAHSAFGYNVRYYYYYFQPSKRTNDINKKSQ